MTSTTPHSNPYPKSGPVRGLIRRAEAYRRWNTSFVTERFDRDIAYCPEVGRTGVRAENRQNKTCPWCGQHNSTRAYWHPDCQVAHSVAKGLTVLSGYNWRLILGPRKQWYDDVPSFPSCYKCGSADADETDHVIALSVAHEHMIRQCRGWWKAWHISNLKAICHECHKAKTKQDVARLHALRTERHQNQPSLFAA